MKRFSRKTAYALTAAALVGLPALAFNLDGRRWESGGTTMYVGMGGTSPSGIAWSTALKNAMQQWNDHTDFEFVANESYASPCAGYSRSNSSFPAGGGDARNGTDFRTDVCGNTFEDSVLAITLSLSGGGTLGFNHIVQSDIVFNGNLSWDIYSGNRIPGRQDFGRVALHELGHVLGLNHDSRAVAIMQPTVSNLDALQADDIAGANSIYGEPVNCVIHDLPLNALIQNGLTAGDCRIMDLYGGGQDTSYVDAYRLRLTQSTRLRVSMQSATVDSVLILTDTRLRSLAVEDDFQGSCTANLDTTLPAGEYLLLANTYDVPEKCVGNTGPYTISITDTAYPQLGQPASTSGTAAASLFSGGASSDGGVTFKQQFTAQERIDVTAQIALDPTHAGQAGKVYIMAVLGNGQRYARNSEGAYVKFSGAVSLMPAFRSGTLAAVEKITAINGLQGQASGLAGQSFTIYVGYALDSKPTEVHFGNSPIKFSISP